MTRATERTDSEIHSFSHWVIITRAIERTDSEIYSFSHWVIITRAIERTDSEIYSFSHCAVMTRATGRTDSEIHSFLDELSQPDMNRFCINTVVFNQIHIKPFSWWWLNSFRFDVYICGTFTAHATKNNTLWNYILFPMVQISGVFACSGFC